MNIQIKIALSILLIGLVFAAGWATRGWKEDSVALGIEQAKDATREVIAKELAKQSQVTQIINQKVIERTRTESVYIECKNPAEMIKLINQAIR